MLAIWFDFREIQGFMLRKLKAVWGLLVPGGCLWFCVAIFCRLREFLVKVWVYYRLSVWNLSGSSHWSR